MVQDYIRELFSGILINGILGVSVKFSLHFDNGFWLYYYRLEKNCFKWPMTKEEALQIDIKEFEWLLKGYEVRTSSKFKPIKAKKLLLIFL